MVGSKTVKLHPGKMFNRLRQELLWHQGSCPMEDLFQLRLKLKITFPSQNK